MSKNQNPKRLYEKNLFTDKVLKKYLPKKYFVEYRELKQSGSSIPLALADHIAHAMKKWAIKNGATHYTHWFLPLTSKPAGKHVSFLEKVDGNIIEHFDGKLLIKGETDASSFPNGGERMTFEARGYTVWDYSSPAIIQEMENKNKLLLIPTAFCSYHGVALDEKTPLLRAQEALNTYGLKLLRKLGYTDINGLVVNIGAEQEYFVIRKQDFLKRPDLVLSGRTLFGRPPVKSQERHRNYFGPIGDTISLFMNEVNKRLWKMGITAKIQHNEVAPCQHEIVPLYNSVNISADQNQLLMETMQQVAHKYDLVVLFSEKPFKGINGSGKHTNWSISTDTGINLFDAGINDKKLFLLFFTSVISAIEEYAGLVKLSATYYGNELRLGGDEAPPSIISVYIGKEILDILETVEKGEDLVNVEKRILDFGVKLLPKNYKDNCDRNRTSPFAFTGNKFEFRMVGASQTLHQPNTVLITILANKLKEICEKINDLDKDPNVEVFEIIKQNIVKSKRIIFNGNGYTKEWQEEAISRGLPIFKTVKECYDQLNEKRIIKLFDELNVLKPNELKLRHEILMSNFNESAEVEAKAINKILNSLIIPNIVSYLRVLSTTSSGVSKVVSENEIDVFKELVKPLVKSLTDLKQLDKKLVEHTEKLHSLDGENKKLEFVEKTLLDDIAKIRSVYDSVEHLLPKDQNSLIDYDTILYFNGM